MNTGVFLTSSRAVTSAPADRGHDTPEEIAAARAIEDYARDTGALGGGGTTVRANWDAGSGEVTAWLEPHRHDAVVVRVQPNRTLWAFAQSPDQVIPDNEWMRLDDPETKRWASHRHATAAANIVKRHFGAQLTSARPIAAQ